MKKTIVRPASATLSSIKERLSIILLLGIVFSVYAKMWGLNEPILDDPTQIAYVNTLENWWQCFQLDALGWFRPYKNLFFYMTLGENGDIHWTQIFSLSLLGLNILAFHYLIREIFGKNLYALTATSLFALSPTMVSSVQLLSACNNQISLFLLLLYLQFSLRYTKPNHSQQEHRTYLTLSLLCLSLSLIGYEAAITSAGILIILLIGLKGFDAFSQTKVRNCLIGSLLITFSYLIIRAIAGAKGYFNSPSLPPDCSRFDLILRAPYYTWQHLKLWLWPWGHGGVLMHDNPANHLVSGILTWGVLTIIVATLLYGLFTRYKLVATGALIFLGSLIPLSNYLGFANGPICNYYLLFPSVGLTIMVTELLKFSFISKNKYASTLTIVGLCGYLSAGAIETHLRVDHWSTPAKLREFSLKNYPNNYVHLRDEAILLLNQDELEKGKAYIEKALQEAPWEAINADILARYYFAKKRPQDAIDWLDEYHTTITPPPWMTLMRKGEILYNSGRVEEAYEMLPLLLKKTLNNEETCRLYFNLAVPCLISYGRKEEARELLEKLELQAELIDKWSQRKAQLLEACE